MAYCTNAQVAAEFKNLSFSSSSTPTDTTVDRFIEEADAEINARIGLKFDVPVTGAQALIIARQLSIDIVSERVRRIIRVKTGAEPTRQDGRDGDTAKEARERIEQIVKGTFLLSDATLVSSSDGLFSYNVSEDEEHTFEKGTDQW
jgi:hypothetical protein